MKDKDIIVVCGPTAVGKTKFAIKIAQNFNGEIVSCDSMQLYKYMDIGSAKPTEEERRLVPHYLVDEIDPSKPFSAAKYQRLANQAITKIFDHGHRPVIAGGTGLYLNALLYDMDFSAPPADSDFRDKLYEEARLYGGEYLHNQLKEVDPDAAGRIHPNNIKKMIRALEAAKQGNKVKNFARDIPKNPRINPIMIGLTRQREELYDRINLRVDQLIEEGLLDEVKSLLSMGLEESNISMKGIGYKEIIAYLHGEYDFDRAVQLVKQNTRHLAKHQMTWFKRYEDMTWFDISQYKDDEQCLQEIILWLQKR